MKKQNTKIGSVIDKAMKPVPKGQVLVMLQAQFKNRKSEKELVTSR